ncbi:MAG: hypothetical protein AB7F86_03410 [Bdellovibrionales bacterium]
MNFKIGELVVLSLPWVMGVVFLIGSFLRAMIYYTIKRHEWFATEFEKRVSRYLEGENPGHRTGVSFYVLTKKLLEKTFYETFEVRDRLKRRKNDGIMSISDRIFLIRPGCAWLVKDILKQVKFLKWTNDTPKLGQITRSTLNQNPCFNRIFGIIPISSTNDVLTVLPGLFVVAGILGTFIGIAKGLPTLSGMNIQDLENSKLIMDSFLNEIAFAMRASILGITFSLAMHFWNMFFYPERAFDSLVDRFESSMDLIWYRADNNDFPLTDTLIDAGDGVDKLARESIDQEIGKNPRGREHSNLHKGKAS